MNTPDVSVIVTIHKEKKLIHPGLLSILNAAAFANNHNIVTEIILIVDSADSKTISELQQYTQLTNIHTHHVNYNDTSQSRNYGIAKSKGSYIALFDTDDLMGKTWLYHAYKKAVQTKQPILFHPEYSLTFGEQTCIIRHPSSDEPTFLLSTLFEHNYWISACLGKKGLFTHTPFLSMPSGSGFGYEDWHFYCEALAKDILIRTVPSTVIFVRRKKTASRFLYHGKNKSLLPASKLFEPKAGRVFTENIIMRFIRFLQKNIVPMKIPSWIDDEWALAQKNEPLLDQKRDVYHHIPWYSPNNSRLFPYYYALRNCIDRKTTSSIYTVRDATSLKEINSLNKKGSLVLFLSPKRFDHADRSARYIDFGYITRSLSVEEKKILLAKLFIQSKPKTLYFSKHSLCIDLIRTYQNVLTHHSRIAWI